MSSSSEDSSAKGSPDGWGSIVLKSITATRHFLASMLVDSIDARHAHVQPQIATVQPDIIKSYPNYNSLIKIRLEGKYGIKCIRITYNTVLDSYESFVNNILDRYLPEDAKPFDASDYNVKLKDISDAAESFDIERTEDVHLAFSENPLIETKGYIKMHAMIQKKSKPPVVVPEQPESVEASSSPLVVSDSNSDAASESASDVLPGSKRKLEFAPVTPPKKSPPKKFKKATKGAVGAGGDKLPVRARIIQAVAELNSLGKLAAPKVQVAMFAGYKNPASRGFYTPLNELKEEGIITCDKGLVSLTNEGLATDEAKTISPPINNFEVHLRMKALLKPKEQQIFNLLAADGGGVFSRDEVARQCGYSNPGSKGWTDSIGNMVSLGLVSYPVDSTDPKKKLLQLTDMCFPFVHDAFSHEVGSAAMRAATPPLGAPIGLAAEAPFVSL